MPEKLSQQIFGVFSKEKVRRMVAAGQEVGVPVEVLGGEGTICVGDSDVGVVGKDKSLVLVRTDSPKKRRKFWAAAGGTGR